MKGVIWGYKRKAYRSISIQKRKESSENGV